MECREVRELAEAFVSEQLPVETARDLAAHLDQCPECRSEVEGLRRLRTATRSAFERSPDLAMRPDFAASLTTVLRTGTATRHAPPSSRNWWLAMAASLLLIAGAGWGWREWSSSSSLSAMTHDAVGDHRFCALSFKLAEEPIPLAEAARRFGGIYADLEHVEPSTATLSGGPLRVVARHSCVYDGRRFAHIVLLYKNEAVSLLVTDDVRPSDGAASVSPARLPVTDGFQVASFRGARQVVYVVSSLGQDDVQAVAQAMAGPVSRALSGA